MKSGFYAFLLCCVTAASGAAAQTVACPDLSAAVQIAACPSEDDLKFTFNGFCSDNARMYSRDTEVCTDYPRYRELKNVALWESRDGEFQAYVSCALPPASVKAAVASRIELARKGGITRLICTYRDGVVFTRRTRAECKLAAQVAVKADCQADVSACAATCE